MYDLTVHGDVRDSDRNVFYFADERIGQVAATEYTFEFAIPASVTTEEDTYDIEFGAEFDFGTVFEIGSEEADD